jgi:hypothetical protein
VSAALPRERDSIGWKRLAERSDGRNYVDANAGCDLLCWCDYNSGAALRIPPRLIFQIYPNDTALL